MNTPFRLDQHPRRPQPLTAPPAEYFDQLPTRVMARLPRAAAEPTGAAFGWQWWQELTGTFRTLMAASVLLISFVAAFWLLGRPAAPAATTSLDNVSEQELVGYLLNSGTAVETSDLAVLTAAHPALTQGFMRPSAAEIDAVLDAQPLEEPQYF